MFGLLPKEQEQLLTRIVDGGGDKVKSGAEQFRALAFRKKNRRDVNSLLLCQDAFCSRGFLMKIHFLAGTPVLLSRI